MPLHVLSIPDGTRVLNTSLAEAVLPLFRFIGDFAADLPNGIRLASEGWSPMAHRARSTPRNAVLRVGRPQAETGNKGGKLANRRNSD
jgi:hypothetical protein